ncbi:nucleotidyltransferase domain-containing protein [Cronbergia sp. UHCC 0137]|uniref:nucleotidyltransferase domain-containing protein n=1 Tax=Cronbergia sp. UHCC 0137 TaxID=3110239 RepID=UPI002B1F42BD|nr:nucleotidyltransferase domain-containing protein [Cronbergia sp. UHCC 0137]MEA5620669.1 nucleotidyltransferase domain-containing protein [Cronbergia sp. UHCC 0137]
MYVSKENPDQFDYKQARRFLQEKQDVLKASRFELWKKAQENCQNIIELIINKYQPQQIIQWGSILEPKHFSEASDIDLAVVGLDWMTFMQMFAEAEDIAIFPLDLVRWETLHASFQKILLMKGKIIYEKR